MGKVDCLFLHVPKLVNYYRPIGQFVWINLLPMGLLALADHLHRHEISTQIIHLGVEWVEDGKFSVLDYIREKTPRIVAFDLHWHHQSFDVMEMVNKVRTASPSTFIVLGGYTASFFHEEIMKNFDAVDGIIRGEAEVPMLELAQALLQGGNDLFSIPNLTWRRKGRILMNPLSYVATEEDLNRLSYANFPLLKNYSTYIHYLGRPYYVKGVSKKKNFWMGSPKAPIYHLPVGRGCPVQCTWCGGGIWPKRRSPVGKRLSIGASAKPSRRSGKLFPSGMRPSISVSIPIRRSRIIISAFSLESGKRKSRWNLTSNPSGSPGRILSDLSRRPFRD